MQDEGFHEIQLNGKQLVFLFMAGTVVAVVIFLCGVMVGRGVPERSLVSGAPTEISLDPTASVPSHVNASAGTSETAPVTPRDENWDYPRLLENLNPPDESLAPRAETVVAQPPAVTPAPAPVPGVLKPPPQAAPARQPRPESAPRPAPPAAPATASVASTLAEPAGNGYVVQVAAVRERSEADRMAQRLSGKGYPAFVTMSGPNFRVRVGKFDDRRQAQSMSDRLEREEQFKPWITR
jgi:cell division septation protein DedD